MTIKPVLVPDHDAASLRRLMDHFAEASTGPTRRQLAESRSAVTAAKKTINEGIMDVVKQTFNDCVVGYPQGTSDGQFIQGWARAIRAETGRDISLEKLTQLYQDYVERSDEIMQSHGTTNEDQGVAEGTNDYFKRRKDEEDRIAGTKAPAKRTPRQTDYEKKRKEQGVTEGEGMSRAAKGYEKYGKAGMTALAKAGREGRALDPVRQRYDRYDEAVAEGSAGPELKAIDGDYYEDSTDFFSMFEQDHFDREEESADGMEIRGYIDDVCVMVFKYSTPDMMGGWGIYDDSALIAESGVEDNEEEGETCPECDGAGCPECYGEEDRDRAHDHAQGMERESAGMAEAGQPDVMRHRGDTTVKVVKRAGKPVGEIGIDAEASEGNGQYYVKLYDGSYDAVGFDTAAEALAELKAAISEGITETADGVKYGVFAKGGSVGSQRFRDDPLKTFDTKEEAIADARRRRSGLSKGERGYYRMGYVVKPIKDIAEDDVDDFVAGGGKITQVKPNPGPRRSGVSLGSKHIGTVRGGKASSISGKRANTHSTVKPVVAVEQQVDEKSEAVRHGNNSRSIYHVDESVDPVEQLRADIKRFAQ